MRLFSLLFVSGLFVFTRCQIMLDIENFKTFVQYSCYNTTRENVLHPSGQVIPLANSMENFISIVEKLELNNTDWTAVDTAKMLLKRFSIDGLEQSGMTVKQNEFDLPKTKIINDFFKGEPMKSEKFPEEHLTENEKCSLYYMLSYTINSTLRQGLDQLDVTYRMPPSKQVQGAPTQRAKHPREQGVVSIENIEDQAISLGKVLTGIAASSLNNGKTLSNEIDKDGIRNWKPVVALTLAETLVVAEFKAMEHLGQNRIPDGKWNSTICTTEFKLDDQVNATSYSLLRGAVDGLIIGAVLTENAEIRNNLKLSQLLRAYYSYSGLPSVNTPSYCNREEHLEQLNDILDEQVMNYVKVLSNLKSLALSDLDTVVKNTKDLFGREKQKVADSIYYKECRFPGTMQEPICETPHDVFVIMDTRVTRSDLKTQLEIISYLANRMDMRVYGDSMNIFAYATENEELYPIAFNTTSQGCATCFPAWTDTSHIRSGDDLELFKGLNKTLGKFEFEKKFAPGAPGKIVIYFNQKPSYELTKQKNELVSLKRKHRDVPIIGFGNKEQLKPIVWDPENDVFEMSSREDNLEKLWQRLCSAPAIYQYEKCWQVTSRQESSNKYIGYVTPNHIQYWAMYPEYFLKSFEIKITFKCVTPQIGHMEVCFSRSTSTPEKHPVNCKETSKVDKDIYFKIKDPCKGYSIWNCPPFYFSIKGLRADSEIQQVNAICYDFECFVQRNPGQIKFTVEHEGISCNGGLKLISPLSILMTMLAFVFLRSN
ncbi:uncharacterized protein LOC143226019 [Tachypleus tridentatus]|uniref:uncharacterized protein LOC143226019 n=1 Tax=Tachypleus tridentatus TaxID=6853 RepID=UPI003FD09D8D